MTSTAEQQTKTFHVLLVEDNPGDARLVQELLSEATGAQFELSHVERSPTRASELMEPGRRLRAARPLAARRQRGSRR